METIYQKFETLLAATSLDFKRYLYHEIQWDSRMIGIIGPRGVGKTTMMLQYVKEHLNSHDALYITADDLYFSANRLYDVAESFYVNAGTNLFIDEIHKYPEWSRELKNIYDSFPTLKIIFTGSSILDILKGSADLSRRAIIYELQGLSFREYLNFFHQKSYPTYSLEQIIANQVKLEGIDHPLPLFKDYLKRGYYPFGLETELQISLSQIIVQTLESDIPHYANLTISTSRKLKRLLSIIAESVPFKPNFSKISETLGVSRNSLEDYFSYLEKAGLISQLRNSTKSIQGLGKVDKVYLDNTNLAYNLIGEAGNIGNIRETFFLNQMRLKNDVIAAKQGDFLIGDCTFEVGGKNKSKQQIKSVQQAFVVKDDIEFGYQNVLPLWAFGMNY